MFCDLTLTLLHRRMAIINATIINHNHQRWWWCGLDARAKEAVESKNKNKKRGAVGKPRTTSKPSMNNKN